MMLDYEIEDLIRLRKKGYSYGAIAKVMDVQPQYLKNFCYKNGITFGSQRKSKSENASLRKCAFCGRIIEPATNGPTKEYCSKECRVSFWKEKERLSDEACFYQNPYDTQVSEKGLAICRKKSDEWDAKEVNDE